MAARVRFVGVGNVLDALATANRDAMAGAIGAAVSATALRALGLRLVLGVLDASVSTVRALAIYIAAIFINTVKPSGQAGGTPISGLLIARSAGSRWSSTPPPASWTPATAGR